MAIYISEREAERMLRNYRGQLDTLIRQRRNFALQADALISQGQLASTIATDINAQLTDWASMMSELTGNLTGVPSVYRNSVHVGMPAAYNGVRIDASDPANGGYGTIRVLAAQETTISPFVGVFQAGDRLVISEAEDDGNNTAFTLRYTPQNIGSEVINQGDFSSDTNWTSSDLVDIVVSGGAANFTNAVSGTLRQVKVDMDDAWSTGAYLVSYTVTRSAGSISVGTDVTADFRSVSTSGTYDAVVYNTGNNDFVFTASSFTGTIDNVSVRPWTGLAFTGGLNADNASDTSIIISLEER